MVGADGSLTGYAGGTKKKLWLLEHEGVDVSGLAVPAEGTAHRALGAAADRVRAKMRTSDGGGIDRDGVTGKDRRTLYGARRARTEFW